jgi:hypothetical protein
MQALNRPGELAAGGVGQPGMLARYRQYEATAPAWPCSATLSGLPQRVGRGDDDGAGWFAPALGAAELDTVRVMAVVSWW